MPTDPHSRKMPDEMVAVIAQGLLNIALHMSAEQLNLALRGALVDAEKINADFDAFLRTYYEVQR